MTRTYIIRPLDVRSATGGDLAGRTAFGKRSRVMAISRSRSGLFVALVSSAIILLSAAAANAQGAACGASCSQRKLTLCNDQLPLGPQATADCSASLGSCTGEAFCATFGANFPAASFPLIVDRVFALIGPTGASEVFDLEVYEEQSPISPRPGRQIGTTQSFQIGGNLSNLTSIAPTGIVVTNPGAFRICLRKQFDGSHNVCMDTTPAVANANWVEVELLLPNPSDPTNGCSGTQIVPPTWYEARTIPGNALPHNFVLRAEVSPAEFEATPGAQVCAGGADAGVSDARPDAGPIGNPDADPTGPDASGEDAGVDDAGADPRDAGTAAPDAGRVLDAGTTEPDPGEPTGPPVIAAVSPRTGRSDAPTAITITGERFASGLQVQVGAIAANAVQVRGGTTITATVPPGIAAGVYDLIVTNPDGQSAILPEAFTVTGEGGTLDAPSADSCRCVASQSDTPTAPALLLLFGIALAAGGRTRGSAPHAAAPSRARRQRR